MKVAHGTRLLSHGPVYEFGCSASLLYEHYNKNAHEWHLPRRTSALISLCTPSNVHNVSVFRFAGGL